MTPHLTLTGARVLQGDDLRDGVLSIDQGQITDTAGLTVDLRGYDLLPGIIDLHGDAFERHIAPRPAAPFPLIDGLRGTDRDMAAHGITTAFLAQSWSWEGGLRGADYAETVMAGLAAYRSEALCDLHLQIRYETFALDTADRLLAALHKHGTGYVVFNNHMGEPAFLAQHNPAALASWALRAGYNMPDFVALADGVAARSAEVPTSVARLARAFRAMGVRSGSHDDTDAATRHRFAALGADICEFPTTVAAAQAARDLGNPVLMGAPNVARGGSQSGNIAAIGLIRAGLCDALVSDYHYPALAAAAFRLVDDGVMGLAQAWAMISTAPARIMGLTDRGTLVPGQRADVAIVNRATRRIEGTIAAGRIAYLSGAVAARMIDASAVTLDERRSA